MCTKILSGWNISRSACHPCYSSGRVNHVCEYLQQFGKFVFKIGYPATSSNALEDVSASTADSEPQSEYSKALLRQLRRDNRLTGVAAEARTVLRFGQKAVFLIWFWYFGFELLVLYHLITIYWCDNHYNLKNKGWWFIIILYLLFVVRF